MLRFNIRNYFFIGCLGFAILAGCSQSNSKSEETIEETESSVNRSTDDDENTSSSQGDCGFDDNTYTATIEFYNPTTSYSATYTLDVDVEDCQIIKINFPKGGYLDEDHISAADIDSDGDASAEGEEGKTYQVHIDK